MAADRRPDRWIELAAVTVVVMAAFEELAHVRHRLGLASRRWWEEVEHRDRYGVERSALDVLVPRILVRRLNR